MLRIIVLKFAGIPNVSIGDLAEWSPAVSKGLLKNAPCRCTFPSQDTHRSSDGNSCGGVYLRDWSGALDSAEI